MAFEDGAPLTTLDEKGFPIIAKGIGVSVRQRGDEVRSVDETARVKRPVASKRNASSFAKTSATPCAQTFVKKYELGVDLLVSSGDEDEASDAVRTTDGGRDVCESTASVAGIVRCGRIESRRNARVQGGETNRTRNETVSTEKQKI